MARIREDGDLSYLEIKLEVTMIVSPSPLRSPLRPPAAKLLPIHSVLSLYLKSSAPGSSCVVLPCP